MYTTNELLTHPLVSPAMQPTLGGLPPLLIMVGGGEILRDEQIYVAHKCANPMQYMPPDSTLTEKDREQIKKYKPTDVQLQVWDDLCHVAPTLSFTRPAKYMYRSVAQFGAWALARAQKTEIDILDDDAISVISNSTSDSDAEEHRQKDEEASHQESKGQVGQAGDALPPFKNHMIRQRVTRHGVIFPLPPAPELPGCSMDRELVGVVKQGPVKKWLEQRKLWDHKFATTKRKVHKRFIDDLAIGYEGFGEGEFPPPSALAGRRRKGTSKPAKRSKSMGLALWSLWGSKHDKMTMDREVRADRNDQNVEVTAATGVSGDGARSFADIEGQGTAAETASPTSPRSRSRRRRVTYEGQDEPDNSEGVQQEQQDAQTATAAGTGQQLLTPEYHPPHQPEVGIGVTGKRPYVDGIAVPFSLKKEAETASMMTLMSGPATPRASTSRPMSPAATESLGEGIVLHSDGKEGEPKESNGNPVTNGHHETMEKEEGNEKDVVVEPPTPLERPGLETFVTAVEALPTVKGTGS